MRFAPLSLAALLLACSATPSAGGAPDQVWAACARHADQANEAFARCNRLVHAWYEHQGTGNALLPQNLRSRVWNGHNAAADLWSFFVLTAHLTDREVLASLVRQTLRDDLLLATRQGRLTDDYHIDRNAFTRREPDLGHLIMTNSEYVKDGLLPIIELTGETVWFDRCRDLLDDIMTRAPVRTRFGNLPSESAELNGEMLQSLSRFYWATKDERYKEWVFRIADAYFRDALPKCNGLPCHRWDFAAGKPRSDVLSLSDHGNEIIFGLSEAMVLAHATKDERAEGYIAAMRTMVDTLLKVARNEDGLWVHSIQPSTLQVRRKSTPDTWGYALDGVYALYMVTGEDKYREAVHAALKGINAKKRYRNWGGADAFADSVESGIVLLNRIPEPEGLEWLEATVKPFLGKQKESGIVEGWHGDGNYARTALMYALMKTAGMRVHPWRPDLKFGAIVQDDILYLQLTAERPWQGTLYFDYPRHKHHFRLPMNYPRLNEYPEWFPLDPQRLYRATLDGRLLGEKAGAELCRGLAVSVEGGPVRIVLTAAGQVERGEAPAPIADLDALVKAAGVRPKPQKGSPALTASIEDERLTLRVAAPGAWQGKLLFDYPRGVHRLGRRRPRPKQAEQAPWYAVEPTRLYTVAVGGRAREPVMGDDLLRGLPLELKKGETVIEGQPLPGPPYGGRVLRIEAPHALGGDGPFRLPFTVVNETGEAQTVRLSANFGTVKPRTLTLKAEARGKAALTGKLTEDREVTLTADAEGVRPATHTAKLIHDETLVGLVSFDDQEYKGTPYLWCGKGAFTFTLPARKGQPHTLHLLWGAKGGERTGVLTLNGHEKAVVHGGYDGFQWLKIPVPADWVPGDTLTVRVAPPPGQEHGLAFISEARLTSP